MAPRSKPIQEEDPGGKQKNASIIPNTASCGTKSLLDLVCVLLESAHVLLLSVQA